MCGRFPSRPVQLAASLACRAAVVGAPATSGVATAHAAGSGCRVVAADGERFGSGDRAVR